MVASTTSLAADAWKKANTFPVAKGPTLHIHEFDTLTLATTQLDEQDDVTHVGYFPAGVTVYGLIFTATDMDTGSAALVYKATIGSTDVVTGITAGQTATTAAHFLGTPYTTAAFDLLKITVTTAAATAAEGTLKVRALYTAP